jgi:hypothetical protein
MALAIGLAALAVPSAASAQAVPDASCTSTPSNAVIGQPGNNRGAQTFTAQNTGGLTRAQVEIDKVGGASDWNLSINAVDGLGTPTNTVLAATTVPDASVPDGVGTLTGDFASPATVTAGQRYALVFTRPASDTLRIRYSAANPCPGFAFFSDSQTNPFVAVCGGPNDCDLIFAVFVEPPEPQSVPKTVPSLQPPALSTGMRARALKKCKKKKSKKARKKCKKRANLLPV